MEKKTNSKNLKTIAVLLTTLAFFLCMPLCVNAESDRFSPDTGYLAQDIDMDAPYSLAYSAGLDVVYANVSTADAPTRAFIHEHLDMAWSTFDVQLFNYNGERSVTLYTDSGVGFPQVAKKIGDEIWFSYTGGSGSGYYSVPWDETLAIYPVATPTAEVYTDYNWEVEEDPDGRIFLCGAAGMSGGHAISYVDVDNGNNVIEVVSIGGNSSGFAVDSSGNIWSGEYLIAYTDPGNEMYIEACRLGMWSKDDIDTAIATQTPLTWSDAEIISLGTTDITGETTNWGPNDIEADAEGNIYISLNTYPVGGFSSDSTWGSVKIYSPDGQEGYTATMLGTTIQRTESGQWDWTRSLALDGTTKLADGGYTDPTVGGPSANILYLDMDLGFGYADVDQVVAIAADSDYDSDGVPDSVDNAPEVANSEQQDTDGDGYGNIVDADFNNDDTVDYNDLIDFQSSWGYSEGDFFWNQDVDMNSDMTVDYNDLINYQGHWGASAPYYN